MRRLVRQSIRYVVNAERKNVLPARCLKLPLELFLIVALAVLWRFNLDADELAGNNAYDVRTANGPESIEVLLRIDERAAVVAVVKDMLPRKPF